MWLCCSCGTLQLQGRHTQTGPFIQCHTHGASAKDLTKTRWPENGPVSGCGFDSRMKEFVEDSWCFQVESLWEGGQKNRETENKGRVPRPPPTAFRHLQDKDSHRDKSGLSTVKTGTDGPRQTALPASDGKNSQHLSKPCRPDEEQSCGGLVNNPGRSGLSSSSPETNDSIDLYSRTTECRGVYCSRIRCQ